MASHLLPVMFWIACRSLLALLLTAPAWTASAAEPRFAVVIGNASYAQDPLPNPINDARTVAASLAELGFEVLRLENATLPEMRDLASRLRAGPRPGSVAVFYYAGHALQHRGHNYLLPVDFELTSAADLPHRSIRLGPVLQSLYEASPRLSLLVLDACRNNPFGQPEEALGPGLAPVENAPGETLVAYATAAGHVAQDGTGLNSPFTAAFVSALEKPGLGIYDVFREVRGQVREATSGQQLPWVSGSVESDFVLRRPGTAPVEPDSGVSLASVWWNTIRDSADPRDFDQFLSYVKNESMVTVARERRAAVVGSAAAAIPEPEVQPVPPMAPAGGLLSQRTACDLAVSSPADPMRVAEGVHSGLVNVRLATRLCIQALARDAENPRLQFLLGRALDIAERREEARAMYERAAAQDYAAALGNLAYMYREGRGVAPNQERAFALYRRAARLGLRPARSSIGYMYRHGLGVPKAPEEAFAWIKLAAEDNWAPAFDQLGDLYRFGEGTPKDPEKAFESYLQAAQLGNSSGMKNVGRMFREGFGVKKDVAEGVRWLEQAMAAGNQFAPRELALMYERGWHLKRDPARAIELYELSAGRGYIEAYADVAAMYEKDEAVPKDLATAYYYYQLTLMSGLAREQRFRFEPAEKGLTRLAALVPAAERRAAEERARETVRRNGPVPARSPR